MRRMLQQRVGQLERRHRMVAGRRWLELVRGASAECQHLEEFGTVQLIRIDTERGTGRVFRIMLYQTGEKYPRKVSVPLIPNSQLLIAELLPETRLPVCHS